MHSCRGITRAERSQLAAYERRRRWPREEEEGLVAACLEPGAVISEIARAAGIHVSKLFRRRKELCRIEKPIKHTNTTLVPVIVSGTAPSSQPVTVEPPMPTRRRRSDPTIELGRGRRVCVDSDIDTEVRGRILDVVLGLR